MSWEGKTVGGVQLEEVLGRGGMGVVYRGWDEATQRWVALKVLACDEEELADSVALERFEREAQALAAIQHPNVLRVHRSGSWRGAPYLVTELIRGSDLEGLLAEGPLDERRAEEILREIARGLEAIHAAGLVHRDLKPANVLIDEAGRVKISDFGVVTGEQGLASLTVSGALLGTPTYMAPEALRGERVREPSADVYSFGVLAYQLLVGRPPPTPNSLIALAAKRQSLPCLDPREEAPGVAPRLAEVVRRATARDPQARYPHGGALRRVLEARPDAAVRGWSGALPLVLAGAFALSTALWMGSRGAPPTGPAQGSRDADPPRAPAVGQVEDPAPALGPAVDLSLRSTVARAPAHHEFWDAVLDDERVHVYALDSLKRGQLATFPPAALEDTLPAERVEPTATVGPLGGLAWGAAEFAFGAGPKLVVQGYGAGRLTLELPPASGRLSALSWGADGALWVGTDAGQLWRLPADRERLTQVGAVDGVVEQVVASDPERRVVRIVQSTPRGPRSAWLALEGGSARPLWEADDDRATSGAADVDGVLVWGTAEGHVYLRRAGTTALCEEVSPHGRVVDVALAGPWVVGVLRQDEGLGELRVWDARSLALRARAPISGTPRAVDVQVRGERVRLLVTCFETLTVWDLGVGVR